VPASIQSDEFSKIIFWAPSGREFVIKDVNKFQQIVLPRFFRHSKMNSFIRQLNMYGFHKSRADHSKSVFSHPLFLKDRE
jgi:heat shock transcription factor 1